MSNTPVKNCEFCGAMFTPKNGNAKYCGALCRDKAAKAHRKQWELENNYKESQRLRMQEARRTQSTELKQARAEADEKQREAKQKEIEQRAKQSADALRHRAEQGDTFSKMIIEQRQHGKVTPEYWELFKQYELEKGNPDTKINGIPLTHNSFALAVVLSIEDTGAIIKTQ